MGVSEESQPKMSKANEGIADDPLSHFAQSRLVKEFACFGITVPSPREEASSDAVLMHVPFCLLT